MVMTLLSFNRLANADPASQLTGLLAPLNSLSGHFEQTLMDDKGEVLQVSSGVFSFKRPGSFRWQTLQPFPQLLVSNQQTIWLYDEDLAQVIVRPYTEKIDKTPALLLSGSPNRLLTYYRVAHRSENVTDEPEKSVFDGSDTFILTSQGSESDLFTEIVLTFNNRLLSKMALTDTLGQVSLFRFSGLTVNPSLAGNLFTFEPPPDVDVIVDD